MVVGAGPLQSDSESEGVPVTNVDPSDSSPPNEGGAQMNDAGNDPPSKKVLQLLKHTSKALSKSEKAKQPNVKRLCNQLESLRAVIPNSYSPRSSCVIEDALNYREKLRRQLQTLRAETKNAALERLGPLESSTQVEVIPEDAGMQINISCKRKPGLMVTLIEAIERLGLVLERVNVSCQNDISIQAFGKQARLVHLLNVIYNLVFDS